MDTSSEELTGLALAAQRGEPDARDGLIRVVRPAVMRYLLARGLSEADTDDLTQDVCLAVLQAIARWRDEGRPVWAIVFAIVRNKLADRGRLQGRRKEDLCEDMAIHDQARQESPEDLFERRESTGEVHDLLNSLPATQREVVLLRIIVGLSAAETAEALGLTPGSVRVIQHRGLTALRQKLQSSAAVAS